MQRILVIRGGAIGDFVLTLPAIRLLREEYPDAHLEILGYKHIVALAEQRFYADATRSIEYGALASFFARGAELPDELADYFSRFELVVSYLFDPDGIFQQNLDRSCVDYFIAANPKVVAGEHAAVQLAQALGQHLNLRLSDPAAQLFPAQGDRQFASHFLANNSAPLIALHPGSGSASKNWPLEQWVQLGTSLLDAGTAASLLVVGGEADHHQVATLKKVWRGRRVVFAENVPLPELAAVLEQCALFLGHDSGISHIAAAVGTPCVLLFGPTEPTVWAPAHPHVQVLRSASGVVADLPLDAVLGGAATLLARYAPGDWSVATPTN
ncbi:N/A [soil metagenome]